MTSVWKVGSRWGNMGMSILDLFMEYECVFFGGKSEDGIGDWGSVQKGDFFIVSDGRVPVAIGESLGVFLSYKNIGIQFRKRDADEFIDDEVVLCPARLVLLEKAERAEYWGVDPQKRFCRATTAADKVRRFWEKKGRLQNVSPFSIVTRVASILEEQGDVKPLLQTCVKYSMPVYQRPYSWGERELRRLMEDLHQGLSNDDPVFMGTMQLSQPIPLMPDGSIHSYNVIDGQQRLTTFIILVSVLERLAGMKEVVLDFAKSNIRTSVNRRAAQNDLDAFFVFLKNHVLDDETPSGQEKNPYIANAKLLYELVREFACSSDKEECDDEIVEPSAEVLSDYATQMREFISKRIRIVVIETHAGLSKTLKIFNAINSSGLDLGSEDLFKVRFYEYLRKQGESEEAFDRISEVYELIEEYNRNPCVNTRLSMSDVLISYQRVLIARCGLNVVAFSMAQETFFERLFDTVLGVHIWGDFKMFISTEAKSDNSNYLLTTGDLRGIAECHIAYLKACHSDVDLRIIRQMYWESRYSYARDFPVLAMFNGFVCNKNVKDFALGLLKSLIPPSIYFAKHVYHGRVCLLTLLKAIWNGDLVADDDVTAWCVKKWSFKGLTLQEMTDAALNYQIAWTPRWKNLICKIVEYIKSLEKDTDLYVRLFCPPKGFDIEHIQSFTAEDDKIRHELGWDTNDSELNKIGNLAMFESNLNRSVQNKQKDKQSAYSNSHYICLKELSGKVSHWSKTDAMDRRVRIADDIKKFLFGIGVSS